MKEKIKTLKELQPIIADLKSTGKKIVHCHGVFDLLHIGHIKHFEEAKTFGDILVVTITPDDFVHKGPNRPAFTTELRLEVLAALVPIDFVGVPGPGEIGNLIAELFDFHPICCFVFLLNCILFIYCELMI